MNLEKLIRFGFASRRRRLLTLTLAGAAGVTALVGGGADKSIQDNPSPAEERVTVESTTTTTALRATTTYYTNCAAVRAAGKAPLRVGDASYRSALDRDGDGIACDK